MQIEPLASHPEVLPQLQVWFELQWPDYYGTAERGSAEQDLRIYSNRKGLPYGVVAFRDGLVCGVAALKADSIASHAHLSPWAAAGLVRRELRRQGIGEQLVLALERHARTLGFSRIYSGTSTADALLQRIGWQLLERVDHEGQALRIYEKAL